jgi:hypothetical protein
MAITINGTTGIAGVDGSASTPSLQGADTNTGMFFPAADTIAFAEGGAEVMRIDSAGNVGIGTSSPTGKLQVNGAGGVSGSTNLVYVNVTSSFGGISVNSTANNNSFVELLEAGTKVGGFNADTTNNVTSVQSAGGHALAFNVANTTEVGRFYTSGNLQFNSGYGSVATAYGCRAWVNFNGTGTVAIRGSGNVSSITDNNIGRYTVNMTTAISDTNYAVTLAGRLSTGTTDNQGYANLGGNTGTYSTTAFTVNTLRTDNDDFIDAAIVGAAVFR